jgi:hypothetical protein
MTRLIFSLLGRGKYLKIRIINYSEEQMRTANTSKPVMNGETHEKLMRLTKIVKWLKSLCGEAPKRGHVKRGLFLCPHIGKTTPHIPESLGAGSGGQLPVRDRGNGLKTQPVVYHWTKGVGWVTPTSYELMRMKVVNHKPMNHLEGNPHPSGWGGGQLFKVIFNFCVRNLQNYKLFIIYNFLYFIFEFCLYFLRA